MEGLGSMNKNQSNVAPPKKQTFSWKTFIIALIVAFFLNIFISAITGVEPRKNIMWTALWIYLSIEAWKFWKWKALLPYPLYLVINLVLTLIFLSVNTATGLGNLSWSHISAAVFLNIGGLITFYLFLSKSQHNQDIAAGVSPPVVYATVDPIAKGRTTQLQERTHRKPTIENKVTSKEKAILEELRNESILTANEFIEKMAVVDAREEAERFEKLLRSITEPFINKISKLKNAGLLNEQEYEQKKRKIIEKHRAELLDEQEQKKRAMIKQEGSVLCDDDIRECPRCGMENRIQKISVGFIQKCNECGNIDYFKEKPICETSWENRVLCSDESCIGVIRKDGKCKICGKRGDVELPKNDRST